jgi:hypothetical protein
MEEIKETLIEKKQRKPRVKKTVEDNPAPAPKEKKPRAYSFIQAFSEWRKANNWSGLCPKKGTDEYDQIRKIYDSHK